MNGLNCSILAYGQTGSGKTYTMIGYDSIGGNETGVVPRLCTGLLHAAEVAMCNVPNTPNSPGAITSESDSNDLQPRYRALGIELSLSYYEIYNERVYDLLSTQPEVVCRVRESREDGTSSPHTLTLTTSAGPTSYHILFEYTSHHITHLFIQVLTSRTLRNVSLYRLRV